MNKLKSAYLKKALFFPLVVIAILTIIAALFVPTIIANLPVATDQTQAVRVYDAEKYDYYLKDYESFDDLKLNRFVGWLSSDDLGLGCPVSFDSENEDTDSVSLVKGSVEPWNGGCVVIIGSNSDKELRNTHRATTGDEITIDFYSNDSYTYKIKNVETNVARDEIFDYQKDNSLIICRPYRNFEKDGSSFYTIFVAELVEE